MQDNELSPLVKASDTPANPENPTESSEDFARMLEQRRRETGSFQREPRTVAAAIPIIPAVQPSERPCPTEEQLARRDAAIRQREREAKWSSLVDSRGSRYRECRLANFQAESPEQIATVASLRAWCENADQNVRDGVGVILFGPRGTGKDHLAMAVARAAVMAGRDVVWRNGMDLFGDFRDAIDEDGKSEGAMVRQLVNPAVLYMSDPLPVVGPMSPHQMNMLFRILDGRYSRGKPTICTVNVANGDELDSRMGPQTADRLKDNALAIYCNWGSYRKVKRA